MDNRADIREFLATRRARISPEQAGLPAGGGRRRVPGLRREEVAVLAGVSTDWYTRLEKGHINGVSEDVLDAVARALQLDEAERTYLFDLARAARPNRRPHRRGKVAIPPSVQWMLDSMASSAAIVRNGRMDMLAANALGRALYSPMYDSPLFAGNPTKPNLARFQFLDQRAVEFWPDWESAVRVTVALLRTEAGRYPNDKDLRDLVGELSTVSDAFRGMWATHDVRLHTTGTKTFVHPDVGPLELTFHSLDLPTDTQHVLNLTIYTPEPASHADDALRILASHSLTPVQPDRNLGKAPDQPGLRGSPER